MSKQASILIQAPKVQTVHVSIEGTSDLILNAYTARARRMLTAEDRKTIKEKPNLWEDLITAIHWYNPLNCPDTYNLCDQQMMNDLLEHNNPCITAKGLKESFANAVVRNEFDKYSTKFKNAVNVIARGGLVPVTFSEWHYENKLMSPQRGKPINQVLNYFSGWKATFRIDYTDNVFSLQNILDIITYAGFGLGIGSSRNDGFGRYKIIDVK